MPGTVATGGRLWCWECLGSLSRALSMWFSIHHRVAHIGQTALSHRVQVSHFDIAFFTNGVSRVRLYKSPTRRIASAWVGYG